VNILFIVGGGSLLLLLAYFTYGKFISKKVFEIDDKNLGPSIEMEDGVDYVPTDAKYLAGQHFSAIADTIKEYVSKRVWILFNIFIFFTLIMLIVAFTDITTLAFVNSIDLAHGEVIGGGATATSSILYLILPVIMGFLLNSQR